MKIWLGGVNLAVATAVMMSCGVEPSLPVWITSLGVRNMRAPLCTVSVKIYFGSTVWRVPKVTRISDTPSMTSW